MRVLILALLLSSCAGMKPGPYQDFWDQCVKLKAYGLTTFTQWGPYNLGVLEWERNTDCQTFRLSKEPMKNLYVTQP